MNTNTVTLEQARRVLEVVDAGLSSGLGHPKPGAMCVEAAVCFALGLPHGDNPPCVHPLMRAYKIQINDMSWSSKKARAEGLRRVAVAQLGSVDIDGAVLAKALAEQTIRLVVPAALRAAASVLRDATHKAALEAAAARCEQEGSAAASAAARAAARDASYAASAAVSAAASYDASDAASYAVSAASYAASAAASAASYDASDVASDAAIAASYAAIAASYAVSAARYAARYAASDAILGLAAEACVMALRTVGADGVKLMDELLGP